MKKFIILPYPHEFLFEVSIKFQTIIFCSKNTHGGML